MKRKALTSGPCKGPFLKVVAGGKSIRASQELAESVVMDPTTVWSVYNDDSEIGIRSENNRLEGLIDFIHDSKLSGLGALKIIEGHENNLPYPLAAAFAAADMASCFCTANIGLAPCIFAKVSSVFQGCSKSYSDKHKIDAAADMFVEDPKAFIADSLTAYGPVDAARVWIMSGRALWQTDTHKLIAANSYSQEIRKLLSRLVAGWLAVQKDRNTAVGEKELYVQEEAIHLAWNQTAVWTAAELERNIVDFIAGEAGIFPFDETVAVLLDVFGFISPGNSPMDTAVAVFLLQNMIEETNNSGTWLLSGNFKIIVPPETPLFDHGIRFLRLSTTGKGCWVAVEGGGGQFLLGQWRVKSV